MQREARRHFAPPRVVIGSLLALLLFLGALDLHSPKLIATYATTTPVLGTAASSMLPGHIEPVDGVLAPDHPPALFKALKTLDQPRMGPGSALLRPRFSGTLVPSWVPRQVEGPLERRTPSRGPPLSPSV